MSARNGILYREVTVGYDEEDNPIKERLGFSFTMNFWNAFCKMENIKMLDIGTVFNISNPRFFEVCQNVLYCSALAYAEVRDKPFNHSPKMAGEWITEMEQTEFNEVVQQMTESRFFGKNLSGLRANNKENPEKAA
jgi:hypothetical protein